MNKFKKISLVVLTFVFLVSSFAIFSFALPSEEALEGASLPKVSFSGVRENGDFYTGTDVMFPAIDTDPEDWGIYHAQNSGDVNGSVRSRWSYIYDGNDWNHPFVCAMVTNNLTYDIIIDFPLLALDRDDYGDIGWDFQTCYNVSNSFAYTPTDQNEFTEYNFLITLVLVDSRGTASPDPNFVNGSFVINLSLPYVISLRDHLNSNYSDINLDYVSVSRMVISVFDNSYSTYGELSLHSFRTSRYSQALEGERFFIQQGLAYNNSIGTQNGYNDGYTIGYDEGHTWGYLEGQEDGYNLGYQRGYEAGLSEDGIFGFIIESVEAFLTAELFPGFSFGLLLTCIAGLSLFIWFLKIFAGG